MSNEEDQAGPAIGDVVLPVIKVVNGHLKS